MELSKKFYLGSILGAPIVGTILIVMGVVGGIAGAASGSDTAAQAGLGAMMGIMGIAWLAFIYGTVVQMVLLYKCWSAIQDGQARTTPGKAVGFMFIPLFNLYWMFQVIYGFAQDYNKYVDRQKLNVAKLDEKLFLFLPIAVCACIVPLLNMLAGLVVLVLAVIVAMKMIDGVNALKGARPQQTMAAAAGA
ncbi:MAG TPA: hypothetical protein VM056_03730 [Terriglobales bacterium]|nr:hypothetical protein [Terriglobales bacterium]